MNNTNNQEPELMDWAKSIGMAHKNTIFGFDKKVGRYLYAKPENSGRCDRAAVIAILTPDRDQRLYHFGLNYIIQAIERNETVIVFDRYGSYERGVRDILKSLPSGQVLSTIKRINFNDPDDSTASWCMLDELALLKGSAAINLAYHYAGIIVDNHPKTKNLDAETQNILRNYIYLTLLTCNIPVFDSPDGTGRLLISMKQQMDLIGKAAKLDDYSDKDAAYEMYSWLRAEVERSQLPRSKEELIQTQQTTYDILFRPMLDGGKLFGYQIGDKAKKNVFDKWRTVVFVRPPLDDDSEFQQFFPMFMHYLYTLHYVRKPGYQMQPPRDIGGAYRDSMSYRYTVMFMDMQPKYYAKELFNFAEYYKSFGVSTVFAIDDFGGMCQSRYGKQAVTEMVNTADYTILHPADCMWKDIQLAKYLSVDKQAKMDDLHRYGSVQVYAKGQREPAIVNCLNSDDMASSLKERIYMRIEKKRIKSW